MINNYGADAVRWYMISNSNPWDNLKFDEEGVAELNEIFLELYIMFTVFLVSMQILIIFHLKKIL